MFKRQTKVWGKLKGIILILFFVLTLIPSTTSATHPDGVYPEPNHSLTGSSNREEYSVQIYNYLIEHGWEPVNARRKATQWSNISSSGERKRAFDENFIDLREQNLNIDIIPENQISCPTNPPVPDHELRPINKEARDTYANSIVTYIICNNLDSSPNAYDKAVEFALKNTLANTEIRTDNWNRLLKNYAIAKQNGNTSGVIDTTLTGSIIENRNKLQDFGECGYNNLGACIYDGLAWILNFFIYAAGYLLRFVAAVFRVVIKISIIDFAKLLDNEGMRFAWRALRDIANLFFIFILLYAAVGTILRISRIDAKKIVINVILVAIFINFSFLISKIIIDAGNQLALFFYNRITTSETGTREIDETLMTALRVVDTVKLTGSENVSYVDGESGAIGDIMINQTAKNISNLPSLMVKGIGAIVIIVLTTFIIGSAAYMFLARAVILALLAVTSPLAFLLMAFPPVGAAQGVSSKWWSNIVNQSLVAPAYLILLWAVLIIVSNGGAALDHGGSAVGDALFFFIVAYMLYWSFSIAIEMGGHGAEFAKKSYDNLRKKTLGAVKGAALGTAGFAGRNIVGGGAAAIANSVGFRKFAASTRGGGLLLKGLDATANASFGGRKGGFIKATKDAQKSKNEFADRLLEDQRTGEKLKGEKAREMITSYESTLGKFGRRGGLMDYIPGAPSSGATQAVRKSLQGKADKAERDSKRAERREDRVKTYEAEQEKIEKKINDLKSDKDSNYQTNKGLGSKELADALNSGKTKKQAIDEELARLEKIKLELDEKIDRIDEMNAQAAYRSERTKKGKGKGKNSSTNKPEDSA